MGIYQCFWPNLYAAYKEIAIFRLVVKILMPLLDSATQVS